MAIVGNKNPDQNLESIGIKNTNTEYWNLSPADLTRHTLQLNQGWLNDTGALVVDTGKFTGRSPDDKFIVKDSITEKTVDWNSKFNIPFDAKKFDLLYNKVVKYFEDKNVYVRDSYACADPRYRLNIRVINEYPWQNLFANNLFLRPTQDEIQNITPDWLIVAAPGFMADPEVDGTRQSNFAIINFTKKIILIGGTAYTGEIKKGIFSVLNFVLPNDKNVLSMHCSANVGKDGDTAIFFGLSGTGKTTLSADPERGLIGDDEHGWTDDNVFNFEGGCYAKCVNLSEEKEPQIWNAIREGALLENVKPFKDKTKINYDDISRTENTRVAYPLDYIDNAVSPSSGKIPKNIFFLTYDASGVFPPISRLTEGQAMFHFLTGYTSKVAGTETGVTEPKMTFSTCFGAPFLPLHPTKYADMLGEKMKMHKTKVWMINTGMTGGQYGVGTRMKLSYTRALIHAALEGKFDDVEFENHPVFGMDFPTSCPGVPADILNPRNTWADKDAYDKKANDLADAFVKNFEKFRAHANADTLAALPKIAVM